MNLHTRTYHKYAQILRIVAINFDKNLLLNNKTPLYGLNYKECELL